MRTRSIAFLAAVLLSFAPKAARADDPGKVAAATVLFDEGVRLMDQGKAAEACPKLAQSQELAPSGGTLLALGECYEKIGRVASAWLALREAAARAASAGKRDSEVKALDRAQKLERRLPKLTIKAPPGVEVRRDNTLLTAAEIGLTTPVDPGSHEIRATAPGKKSWSKVVDVPEGNTLGIEIPPLENEGSTGNPSPHPNPNPNPPPEQPVEPPSDGSTQRILGLGVAGAGIVALGIGTVFGVMASADNEDAKAKCSFKNGDHVCSQEGLDLTENAESKALVSTILFIAGGVLAAGGAALYFTAPSAPGPAKGSVRFTPTAGPTGFGGAATVRF